MCSIHCSQCLRVALSGMLCADEHVNPPSPFPRLLVCRLLLALARSFLCLLGLLYWRISGESINSRLAVSEELIKYFKIIWRPFNHLTMILGIAIEKNIFFLNYLLRITSPDTKNYVVLFSPGCQGAHSKKAASRKQAPTKNWTCQHLGLSLPQLQDCEK